MPVKHLFGRGIGFSPGSIKFIPTKGYSGEAVEITAVQRYLGGGGWDGGMFEHVRVAFIAVKWVLNEWRRPGKVPDCG